MTKPAITVENLSKAYRIGLKEEIPDTLLSAATSVMRAPLKNLKRLRGLNTYSSNGDADDILWALKDVSFEVQEGEVLGVIGRNGAGKSTLLKVLSRITKPTSGRAIIRGRVSSLLEVGTGFHPELTGRENVYMNGTILGMTKREIDRKFDEIVDFSGVEKFLDTPVKRYSSGMKVRLAFAVAAHLEPEILIIDEVLAVGDAEFQKKCLGKMQDVSSDGRTVLFVSHNIAAVESLCDVGVFVENGRVATLGPIETITKEYLSRTSGRVQAGRYVRSSAPRGFCITTAEARSDEGYCSAGYQVGRPLAFRVTCYAETTVTLPCVGIGINNDRGQRIVTLHSTANCDDNIKSATGVFTFECRVLDLMLAPARYHVKLALEDRNGIGEVLEPAFSFDVLERDIYGTLDRHYLGLVYCSQAWSFSDDLRHNRTCAMVKS